MKIRFKPKIIIPGGIVILFVIIGLLGGMDRLEYTIFDFFLRVKKAPTELSQTITLVDFDDQSAQKVGTWPISRDIMANGLMLLRECGSRYAVFDIEYVDKSPRGINSDYLATEIPEAFSGEFGNIGMQMGNLIHAFQNGSIPLSDADPYVNDFQNLVLQSRDELHEKVEKITQDNDEYLAGAIRLYGNAFLTLHLLDTKNEMIPEEARKLAIDRFAMKNVTMLDTLSKQRQDVQPPILSLERVAKGLGFTNIVVDADGVRRRVELVGRYGDTWFPQLVFAPLLDMLGNPAVTIAKREITLKNAQYPDGSVRTVRIPLDHNGRFIVNWPHKKFLDSFTHLSFAELIQYKEDYDNLVYNLKLRENWGYLNLYAGETPLLEFNRQAEMLRGQIMNGEESPAAVDKYLELRNQFIQEVGAWLDSKPEEQITNMVAAVLNDESTSETDKEQFYRIKEDAPGYFDTLRNNYQALSTTRADIVSKTNGSICILGQMTTGSTDIGINPFDNEYPNMGTHASVINTILTEDFLSDSPMWVSVIVAILATGILVFFLQNKKSNVTILGGLGICVALFVGDVLVFTFTGRYTPILVPLFSLLCSFISLTFIQYLQTEKEKGFIRNAFSHYLSEAVIKDIVGNPDKLKLGGELRTMTAVFTDIKGFSTISEKLTAEELVHLLNEYLTGMSDCILDMGGTIDKYEGDAIICFFGAPLDLPDHALRACQAALRMKKLEAELNVRFIQSGMASTDLLTRIGVNTGEMVVGNMGTNKKMDYTIMGDSVNLASRLEGVNKEYGTWLCVSEATCRAAGDGIVVRRLDRIRVVGKSQPIRIYELVGEKGMLRYFGV